MCPRQCHRDLKNIPRTLTDAILHHRPHTYGKTTYLIISSFEVVNFVVIYKKGFQVLLNLKW